MNQIVECVPNFSEGRDHKIIDQITAEITKINGASLLDVDPGEATNRTVVTIAGNPESVLEAAFQCIRKASELIDMRKHHGAHPRMGATDVCPFVPVSNITMDECVELARKLGKRVGDELGIPVYLYEYAANTEDRRNLAHCRMGEYEGLSARVGKPQWKPDFGPDNFNPRSGATAIGARDFLIAWNINLNTRNTKLASKIANRLRERGYGRRDADGKFIRDENGKVIMEPGLFEGVKAVGWFIDEYDMAQVSINVTKFRETPLHDIFDSACELANEFGLRVTGSELVGLIPLVALTDAGKHYLEKQGLMTGASEDNLVRIAVMSLGLDQLYPFKPEEKVIDYRLRTPGKLVSLSVKDFLHELASDSPAPGGGSVAALCGALSASLSSMIAHLTYDKKGYRKFNDEMNHISTQAHNLKARLEYLIDADTEAFNQVMAAFALPKKTDEEVESRNVTITEANRGAAKIPFEVLSLMPQAAQIALLAAEHGNNNLTPDAGVAGLTAALCARGAAYNVRVNLQSLPNDDFTRKLRQESDQILKEVDEITAKIKQTVESRLWS